jgi:ABC-type enterochelin transport system ATPase subunit
MGFMYGDDFVFLKKGVIHRPADEKDPYDSAMLSDIYDMKIRVANADGNRWIIPSL